MSLEYKEFHQKIFCGFTKKNFMDVAFTSIIFLYVYKFDILSSDFLLVVQFRSSSLKIWTNFKLFMIFNALNALCKTIITRIGNVSINLNVYVQSDVSLHSKSDIRLSHWFLYHVIPWCKKLNTWFQLFTTGRCDISFRIALNLARLFLWHLYAHLTHF